MTTLENLIWSFLSKAGAAVDGKPIAVDADLHRLIWESMSRKQTFMVGDPFADHAYRPEAKMEFNGSPVVIGSAP
jgi:hypothetical protein